MPEQDLCSKALKLGSVQQWLGFFLLKSGSVFGLTTWPALGKSFIIHSNAISNWLLEQSETPDICKGYCVDSAADAGEAFWLVTQYLGGVICLDRPHRVVQPTVHSDAQVTTALQHSTLISKGAFNMWHLVCLKWTLNKTRTLVYHFIHNCTQCGPKPSPWSF